MYYQNLLGQKIGKWTVMAVDTESKNTKKKLVCRCECGTIRSVDAYSLQHRLTNSCGQCKKIVREGNHMRCFMRNGGSFLFDEKDIELINAHTWSVARGYVRTVIKGKTAYLHRLIMRTDEKEVDHINLDRLDNRRCNLRLASHSENQRNRRAHKDNKTGYKGVCLEKSTGKYFAYINCDKERTYLGRFHTKKEAAMAYDQAAFSMHKNFAKTNF